MYNARRCSYSSVARAFARGHPSPATAATAAAAAAARFAAATAAALAPLGVQVAAKEEGGDRGTARRGPPAAGRRSAAEEGVEI